MSATVEELKAWLNDIDQDMRTQDTLHTPGPWTVGKQNRIQAGCLVLIGEREITARPSNYSTASMIEAAANAQLISAAPDLLDAAASACLFLDAHMDDPKLRGVISITLSVLQRAIAKAVTVPAPLPASKETWPAARVTASID